MAPKNHKFPKLEAAVRKFPPLKKHIEKLDRQIKKTQTDLRRRMLQYEEIAWEYEAESFKKLIDRLNFIQKEFGGKTEKRLEELAALRDLTHSFNSFSIEKA